MRSSSGSGGGGVGGGSGGSSAKCSYVVINSVALGLPLPQQCIVQQLSDSICTLALS